MKSNESIESSCEALISNLGHESFEHLRGEAFELQDQMSPDNLYCHNFEPGLQNLAQDKLDSTNPILRHMLSSILMESEAYIPV